MEWLILGCHEIITMWHVIACPMVFLLFSGRVPQEEVLKLMKDDLYWVLLRPFGTFSLSLWAGWRMAYISITWNDKGTTCSCLPNCFYFALLSRLAGRSVQSCKELSFFSIFIRFCPFPQVFGQVKVLLELHEMIRVPHVVTGSMGFNLLCDRGQQGGLLKPRKKWSFSGIFSRLSSFSQAFR